MTDTSGTLIKAGYAARRQGNAHEAKRLFSEGIEVSRAHDNEVSLARSLTGLGQIERDLRNIPEALQHYRAAESIYRTLRDWPSLAHTVRHVGDILRENGSIEEAGPYYEEALTMYRRDPETSPLDLANTLRGFALLKADAGESQQSISLWREARSLYEAAGVQPGVQESNIQVERLGGLERAAGQT